MKFPKIKDLKEVLCEGVSGDNSCDGLSCEDCVFSDTNDTILTLTTTINAPTTLVLKEGNNE